MISILSSGVSRSASGHATAMAGFAGGAGCFFGRTRLRRIPSVVIVSSSSFRPTLRDQSIHSLKLLVVSYDQNLPLTEQPIVDRPSSVYPWPNRLVLVLFLLPGSVSSCSAMSEPMNWE